MRQWPAQYHVGQLIYMRRQVKDLARGTLVKVKSIRDGHSTWRYRVMRADNVDDAEEHYHWVYEHELTRSPPGA